MDKGECAEGQCLPIWLTVIGCQEGEKGFFCSDRDRVAQLFGLIYVL